MESQTDTRFIVKELSPDIKVIIGGKGLQKETAIQIAFPNLQYPESFGFKIQGNNLQIRKYKFH